jgi:hypothetical protein
MATSAGPRAPRVPIPSYYSPMLVHPVRYLWMNRSTHSDVMATSTTTEINKVNNKSGLSIQLPSFTGKHLSPHVSVPSKRKSMALVKERDQFMARLEKERNDRSILETWAIIRIQALARGHLGRLSVDRLRSSLGMKLTETARRRFERTKNKSKPQLETSIFDAEQLRAQLAELTMETDMYMELIGSTANRPEWKKHMKKKTRTKKEKRKRKMLEKISVQHIQRVVRGFLGRRASMNLKRRTKEFNQHWSSVLIQSHMRRVLSTARVQHIRHRLMTAASIVIQRRARGWFGRVFARMYRIRLRNIQLEDSSVLTIQAAWRHYLSMSKQFKADQERAARKIQAIARGKKGREEYEAQAVLKDEQLEAAIRIQSSFRAKGAKAKVDRVRSSKRKETLQRQHEQAAAVKVQALRRGKNARQAYIKRVSTRRERAALAIQQRSRSRVARKKVQKRRQLRDETNAAQAIQRIHRGKRGRKAFQEKRASQAVALEHEMARMEEDRLIHDEKMKDEKAEEEALKLAQAEREKDLADQLAAAEKIQRIQRGKQGREAASRRKEEKERLEGIRIEEQRRAAAITKIQAAQRRKAAKAKVDKARLERLESLQMDTQLGAVRRRVQGEEDSEEEDEDEEEEEEEEE